MLGAGVKDSVIEYWLQWFGHVMNLGEDFLVRVVLGVRLE